METLKKAKQLQEVTDDWKEKLVQQYYFQILNDVDCKQKMYII